MNNSPKIKTKMVGVRVSPQEHNSLKRFAEKAGQTLSAYLLSLHVRETQNENNEESAQAG
jgi:hypothetical protein